MSLRTILIVGGGIAGLTAAAELLRHGRKIILLEARDRFGGRIHTSRNGAAAVELGAEFIHGPSEPICQAVRNARLTLRDVCTRNRFYDNGALRDVALWDDVSEIFSQIDPCQPDQSFRSFLHRQQIDSARRRIALGFVEGFDAAHPDRISSHALFRCDGEEKLNNREQRRVEQGYGALVLYLATMLREAGATLVTSAQVRKITWRGGQVSATVQQKTNAATITADAAVITVPLGVLKAGGITFEPALPTKQEAAAGLEFGNVTKVTLTFGSRWWADADFGFIHALNEPIPTWWSNPQTNSITGWAGGPRSDALQHCAPGELRQRAVDIIARVLGEESSRITKDLASVHVYNWGADPYARGAYSYVPVNGLCLPNVLAAPVHDTLFFAGEATATDAQIGTVMGAYTSGFRAASEILALDR